MCEGFEVVMWMEWSQMQVEEERPKVTIERACLLKLV